MGRTVKPSRSLDIPINHFFKYLLFLSFICILIPTVAAAATFTVQVAPGGYLSFSPSTVNVNTGDTVQWVWMASGHSTTSGTSCTPNGPGPGTWDSGILSAGATFQVTFNTPGTFPYFCIPHCSFGMVGTVNVSAVGPTTNIAITPASVSFGSVNVGQFSDQMITITNQATSTATLTGNVGTLAAPFSVQSGGGAFSLTPGQSTTVTVRFSPTAAGAATANLSITHNATNQSSPTTVPLSGTGVTPVSVVNISVTPASANFGKVNVGHFLDRTITITNQATSNATLTGNVGTLVAPFSVQSGGGPFSLTPGQSTTVTVRFSPTTLGAASGNLSITHNATNQTSPTSVSLTGIGGNAFIIDFDGDGKSDVAVWDPSSGAWDIIRSSDGMVISTPWGAPNDIPVPGDYDGDGKTDIAIWRPSNGFWYIINSSNGTMTFTKWGVQNQMPVPGDYDGDGKTDIAIWDPSNGTWYIIRSSDGIVTFTPWGAPNDIPVPGDYDGDGKTDIAIWRPSNGFWYIINSSNGTITFTKWGVQNDIPISQ